MDEEELNKSKQQIEELKALTADAKQAILNVKNDANNAKQVLSAIESYSKKLEEIRTLLDNPESGLVANHGVAQKKKEEIDALKASSDEQLNNIKSTLAEVQQNIGLMNEAYKSFEEVNAKIKNPEGGLGALHSVSTKLKEEIDALKASSDEQLNNIKSTLAEVQQNIGLMNEAYKSFTEIKEKIDDPEKGLIKILEVSETTKQEIIAIKKQSDTLFQEIKKFRDEASTYAKDIENLKQVSEENKNSIEGHEKASVDLRSKIEKIYKIATDSNLANSFDERKKEINTSKDMWLKLVSGSTALLAVLVMVVLWPVILNKVDYLDGYTWYRLTITSPLIFFIIFATMEYSKERNLLERYAFKSATALSLEGYTTLLINTFGKEKEVNEEKILEFVINSMAQIYQEPFQPTKESKVTISFDGKVASLKADIAKTMEETKKSVINGVKEEIKKALPTNTI